MADVAPVIIIKKVKKSHGGAHHGGNWKVAYADFMTAMMVCFLLLWLLNSVTEEQMAGIANYFSPTALSYTMSGAGGMFGGQSMLSPGAMKNSRSEAGVTVSLMPLNENEIPDIEGMPAEKKGTLEEDDILDEPGALGKSKDAYNEESADGEKAENQLYSRNLLKVDVLDDESASEILQRLEQQGFAEADLAAELISNFKSDQISGQELAEELEDMLAEQGLEGSDAGADLLELVEQQTLANAGIFEDLRLELEREGFEDVGLAAELIEKYRRQELTGEEASEEMRRLLEQQGLGDTDAGDELLEILKQQLLEEARISDQQFKEHEQREFERAEASLRRAIEQNPALKEFAENLIVDMTPQGMRIQIADAEKRSMFPSGSAEMYDYTSELLGQIMKAIEALPNDIALIGHTDATPYRRDNGYSNWELSTDRANSSRRALIDAGLDEKRIVRVVGMAAQEPLNVEDPLSAENRRISVLILRIAPTAAAALAPPKG